MVPFESTATDEAKPLVGPRSLTEKPGSTAARAVRLPSRRRSDQSRAVIRAVAKPEACQPRPGKYKCGGSGCYESLTRGDAATIIAPLPTSKQSFQQCRGVEQLGSSLGS